MSLQFTKMQACGNDFVIVDDRAGAWRGRESLLARTLCRRRYAVGGDGLLVLRDGDADHRFDMVFVNADGLVGEMCGNGARCLAAYIKRAGLALQSLQLNTLAGVVDVHFLDDDTISLDLPPAGPARTDIAIEWQGRTWNFDAIDIGAPHAVCFVPDLPALANAPVADLGVYVRHHAAFEPRGANVNFAVRHQDRLFLRTYERGVEAETLGCGTGAAAAALLAHARFAMPSPVCVQTSSGALLTVRFGDDGAGLQLQGGACFVADGVLAPGLLPLPDAPSGRANTAPAAP